MRSTARAVTSLALAAVMVAMGAAMVGAQSVPPSTAPSSVEPARPVGIIAIGHSGLTGEGTGARAEAVLANSWATGTEPAVDSVYLRMVAADPATEGHVRNTAFGGAPASSLIYQARAALANLPAPALAIIQTVDNDIRCDAANVADVGAAVAEALHWIHTASPDTKMLVVGQLGRPSVSFVEGLVAQHPSAKADLTWDDACSFFDAQGTLQEAGFERLTEAIDAYEAETARVCAAVPNCVTDGGVRRAWVDRIELFSADYAHANVQGQAAQADLIWPVVDGLLTR